jgi:hypothetical protein
LVKYCKIMCNITTKSKMPDIIHHCFLHHSPLLSHSAKAQNSDKHLSGDVSFQAAHD